MIFVLRTRTWVPGCLGERSREAWAASPGWDASQGLPCWVPAPNYNAQLGSLPLADPFEFALTFMSMSRGCRFFIVWGSILGPSWGHFWSWGGTEKGGGPQEEEEEETKEKTEPQPGGEEK